MNEEKSWFVVEYNRPTQARKVLKADLSESDAEAFARERAEANGDSEFWVGKVASIFAVNKPQVKRYTPEKAQP